MSATDTTREATDGHAADETAPSAAVETAELGIEGMHCASCVARVEKQLKNVPGVLDALVNLTAEEARVTYAPDNLSGSTATGQS